MKVREAFEAAKSVEEQVKNSKCFPKLMEKIYQQIELFAKRGGYDTSYEVDDMVEFIQAKAKGPILDDAILNAVSAHLNENGFVTKYVNDEFCETNYLDISWNIIIQKEDGKNSILSIPCAELENKRFALFEDAYKLAKKAMDKSIGDGSDYRLQMQIVKK